MAKAKAKKPRAKIEAKRKPGPGRSPKMTDERVQKLLQSIRIGNYLNVAAIYAGIGETTFYTWMKRGETETRGAYREFRAAVIAAEAEAENLDLSIITRASQTQWQAAAWKRERRDPSRWGRTDRLRLSGPQGDDPVQVQISSWESLAQLASKDEEK